MFLKWILFIFVICVLECMEARIYIPSSLYTCPSPHLENGRVRTRQKTKLVRFMCIPRYELVGNKYAICRNGKWDVPLPVCVRPGCTVQEIQNGITIQSRGGAWLMYFCLPGHNLMGSSALYCDGRKWNGSSPVCVDSSAPPKLSCDFEDSTLCGWTQDALHDFDWKRLNKGTPSSVLFTGPSFDHTFGKGGLGYYMYIESTGRTRNDTARLLSPVFDVQLSKDGCFSFFYHMYGETTGGLKVYQKPDKVTLGANKKDYVIFEKWGNQGDQWYNAVVPLKDYDDDFQLIVEGIRGISFTSDIAIDDVSIQQGENCTVTTVATTTAREMDSCADRCHSVSVGEIGCSCVIQCIINGTCCGDFFDYCLFAADQNSSSDDMSTTPEELSHQNTEKLVVSASPESPPNPTIPTEPTTLKTTVTSNVIKPTLTSTTPKTITKSTTMYKSSNKTTTIVVTTKKVPLPTLVFKTSTVIYNATGKLQNDNKTINIKPVETPVKITVKTTKVTHKVALKTTTALPHGISRTFENHDIYHDMIEKAKEEKRIQVEGSAALNPVMSKTIKENTKDSSSFLRTGLTILASLALCAGAVYVLMLSRSARGRELLARLRGHASSHQEVRYLTASVDEED